MRALVSTGAVLAALGLFLTAPASAQTLDGADVKPAFRPGDDKLTCDQIGMEMQKIVESPEFAASMGNVQLATGDMQAMLEREKAIEAAQQASDNALLPMQNSPSPVVRMAAAEELKRRRAARDGTAEARQKPAMDKMESALNDVEATGTPLMPRVVALEDAPLVAAVIPLAGLVSLAGLVIAARPSLAEAAVAVAS